MKYILSSLLILMIAFNGFGQNQIGFEVAALTNSYKNLNTKGASIQINYLSKWTLSADYEKGNAAVSNLPVRYKGPELAEEYNMQSINIGRNIMMDPSGKAWLSTSLGIHTGTFSGYRNFAPPLPTDPGVSLNDVANGGLLSVILFPLFVVDAIQNMDADHYSYTPYSSKLKWYERRSHA